MSFLDEVFTPAFVVAPTNKEKYIFGQVFHAPAYYPHQLLQIWRPTTLDTKLGIATNFRIETVPGDAFKRPLAWTNPPLATNEEFIALKAKPRPVLLIQPPDSALLKVPKGPFSGKIARHLAIVALFYSIENEAGDAKYKPEFVDRVRRLEHRQFMFFKKGGPLTYDSLLRLDCIQSIAEDQLEPSGFAVSPEIGAVLKSQLVFYQTGLCADEFAGWADLLKD